MSSKYMSYKIAGVVKESINVLYIFFQITIKMSNELKCMRLLIRQIKGTSQWKTAQDKRMVQYMLNEARVHKESCEVFCKARTELKCLAENYLLYLTSLQKYQEIQTQFAGKSERRVQETAELVGFKLPNNPK